MLTLIIIIFIVTFYTEFNNEKKDNKNVTSKKWLGRNERRIVLYGMIRRNMVRKHFVDGNRRTLEGQILELYKLLIKQTDNKTLVLQFLEKIIVEGLWNKDQYYNIRYNNSTAFYFKAFTYYYEKKAIRKIEGWKPDNKKPYHNMSLLLNWCFEKYPVPKTIQQIFWGWQTMQDPKVFNELAGMSKVEPLEGALFRLYFHLADGYSFTNADFLGIKISKRESKFWMQDKNYGSPISGLWRAVFQAQGGKTELAYKTGLIYISPKHLKFWRTAFKWLTHQNFSNEEWDEIPDLFDLISYIKFGENLYYYDEGAMDAYKLAKPDFTFKNRTLKSIRRYVYETLSPPYPQLENFEDCYTYSTPKGEVIQLIRLKSRLELTEEGEAMDFCVGGWDYHIGSANGDFHIWSMRKTGRDGQLKRLATLQVEKHRIIEFKGYGNEMPPQECQDIIEQWRSFLGIEMTKEALIE
ncbi:MAG: PcfJ domain-containing protein [Bacteroidota bacterium]